MSNNKLTEKRDKGETASPLRPLICSADGQQENAERKADEYEYREGDIDAFFGCDPDFTGGLTTEEHLRKFWSDDE